MLRDMSGVQDSTAAENVCRLHTQATVGSPICHEICLALPITQENIGLTSENVFVDPSQLDVSLARVCDDKTVYDPFRDGFCYGVA